ncbi:MAG TPA: ThiF family adenylyltransferase [Candidatus Paceibacterota bacterium]|nr:ThiF family adenylyltransferase [Candidatus Paceibacterota bacterium]
MADEGKKAEQQKAVYLLPDNLDLAYYSARIDRNIGWITDEEQATVHRARIGIAGCGGMGGRLAEIFLRLGVGELRLADSELFDASNINRQFAATRASIGKSKAMETAQQLRAITDDTTLVVYLDGITERTVADFVGECDVICDEIEFWCVGARILLHRTARAQGIPVFVANTVGFGSHVFLFTNAGCTMEECLGMSYEDAVVLEEKFRTHRITEEEITHVMLAVTKGLFPEWPEYCAESAPIRNREFTRERLVREGRGAIIATNPPFAAGFLANRVLLYLLQNSPITRSVAELPVAPGYLYLDAAHMQAKVVT